MGRRAEPDAPEHVIELMDARACIEALAPLRRAADRITEAISAAHAGRSRPDAGWIGRAEAALRHKVRTIHAIELRLLSLLLAEPGDSTAKRFVAASTALLPPAMVASVWERIALNEAG